MKRVYFIRHGKSEANLARQWGGHTDTRLTPEGHDQAKRAAQQAKLQGLNFDVIVSSPLARAHDTARYFAAEFGYPEEKIIIHDLFKERYYGVLDGAEYGEPFERYLIDESVLDSYEGIETLAEVHARAQKAWEYIQQLPHDSILIVSHGAFGRSLRHIINEEPMHIRGTHLKNAEVERFI